MARLLLNMIRRGAPFLDQGEGSDFSKKLWAETVEESTKYDPELGKYAWDNLNKLKFNEAMGLSKLIVYLFFVGMNVEGKQSRGYNDFPVLGNHPKFCIYNTTLLDDLLPLKSFT